MVAEKVWSAEPQANKMEKRENMPTPLQNQIIVIETPKGSFVKRNEHGQTDFISPFPCPFNYGHIKGKIGGDGDPLDGLLLGQVRKTAMKLKLKL